MSNDGFLITWGDIKRETEKIVLGIARSREEYNKIYGVSRGGLIPAVMLSHRLGIPMIANRDQIGKQTLIVDDIYDLGRTAQSFAKELAERSCDLAVLYMRDRNDVPDSYVRPDYVGKIIYGLEWLLFPWETIQSTKSGGFV